MREPGKARDLTAEERAALQGLLTIDFAGRAELLQQSAAARVVGGCECGCATVYLQVDPATAPASSAGSPIPSEADVLDEGGEVVGGVIAFLKSGYFSSLEVFSYGDPITAFPPMDRLRLRARGGDYTGRLH